MIWRLLKSSVLAATTTALVIGGSVAFLLGYLYWRKMGHHYSSGIVAVAGGVSSLGAMFAMVAAVMIFTITFRHFWMRFER